MSIVNTELKKAGGIMLVCFGAIDLFFVAKQLTIPEPNKTTNQKISTAVLQTVVGSWKMVCGMAVLKDA